MVELMDVGLKGRWVSFCVQQHMYVGFLYGQAWHGYWSQCVSSASSLQLFKTPSTPSIFDTCGGSGFREFQ